LPESVLKGIVQNSVARLALSKYLMSNPSLIRVPFRKGK